MDGLSRNLRNLDCSYFDWALFEPSPQGRVEEIEQRLEFWRVAGMLDAEVIGKALAFATGLSGAVGYPSALWLDRPNSITLAYVPDANLCAADLKDELNVVVQLAERPAKRAHRAELAV
ncbi:MAG: hypothetical protein AAGJ54_12195 [Planctomycetota bacterium]